VLALDLDQLQLVSILYQNHKFEPTNRKR